MSKKQQHNYTCPSKPRMQKMAKIGLYVMYFIFLFLFAFCINFARATQTDSVVFKELPKPTPEEVQKQNEKKLNALISKAVKDDNAVLVQCHLKKCYDVEKSILLPVVGKDGYYLVYVNTKQTKERIKEMSDKVRELSSGSN